MCEYARSATVSLGEREQTDAGVVQASPIYCVAAFRFGAPE